MADVKFTIDNSSLLDKNGNIDRSHLGDFNRQVNYFKRALESATGGLIRVTSVIDAETGLASANFYVPSEYSSNALSTLKNAVAKARSLYSYLDKKHNFTISRTLQQDVTFYKNYVGKDAQQKAMKEIAELGGVGVLKPTHKNKNRMQFTVPVDKDVYKAMVQALGSKSKANAYFRKMALSAMGGAGSLSAFQQGENAEKDKQQAEKEQAKEEEKRELRKQKEYKAVFNAVNAGILCVADIARRILSAVLTNVTERAKEARDSVALGVSASSVRQYKTAEKVTGLAEGTFTGAIGSLQSAFGDISNLDDKALRELAKVLQGSVISAVNAGLGKNNPEQLMSEILNAYFKRGQSGVNSLGMQVGKYEAQRELATALEKAGLSDLAQILRSMFFNANEGIYKGQINNFEDFKNIMTTYTAGLTPYDYLKAGEIGQSIDNLKAKFDLLAKNLETKLLLSLQGFINKLNSWTIGLSAEEKLQQQSNAVKMYRADETSLYKRASSSKQDAENILRSAGVEPSDIAYEDFSQFYADLQNPSDNKAFTKSNKAMTKLRKIMGAEQYMALANALLLRDFYFRQAQQAGKRASSSPTSYNAEFTDRSLDVALDRYIKDEQQSNTLSTNAGVRLIASTRNKATLGMDLTNAERFELLESYLPANWTARDILDLTKDDKMLDKMADKVYKKTFAQLTPEQAKKLIVEQAETTHYGFTKTVDKAVYDRERENWVTNARVQDAVISASKESEDMQRFVAQSKEGTGVSYKVSNYNEGKGTVDVNIHITDKQGKERTETFSITTGKGYDNFDSASFTIDSGNLE